MVSDDADAASMTRFRLRNRLPVFALLVMFSATPSLLAGGGPAADVVADGDVRKQQRSGLSDEDAGGPTGPSVLPRSTSDLIVPEGFEATIYATDALVHDAYCMTIDSDDRVVVSAPYYIRVLLDEDGDGHAETAIPFANGPRSGAQGLCFDGRDLLAVGDGGLLRYRDADRDLQADGPPSLLLPLKTGGEHHAHAIRRGPDGWWYLMCGNDTGITSAHITATTSPVAEPTAGTLLQFRFDDASGEVRDVSVIADGMRNAYDFDFTAAGDPVTFDSDDEREVSLPWYRPTRVFRLTPGSHAGWFSRSWKRPDLYPEMPEVLASLGRGSPTGVVVSRSESFPPIYWNAVIVCDWTFGRVIAVPLDEQERPGEPIELVRASGTAGFAPTDVEFNARGDMFVSAGGRGTTGTIYRIRYVGNQNATPRESAATPRQIVGTRTETPNRESLFALLREASPLTRRAALESLATRVQNPRSGLAIDAELLEAVATSLAGADANVRKAAMHVVSLLDDKHARMLLQRINGTTPRIRFHLGRLRRNDSFDAAGLEAATNVLESSDLDGDSKYDAVRLAQLALGDVGPRDHTADTFSGYTARIDLAGQADVLDPLRSRMLAQFPTGDKVVDEEFVRLVAMLQPADPQFLDRLLERIAAETHPTDDLHHLFALARLPAIRNTRQSEASATALLAIDVKLAERGMRQDSNWGERLSDLTRALFEHDAGLADVLIRHPDFGRPGHVPLIRQLTSAQRTAAANAFLQKASASPGYTWSPEVVALAAEVESPEVRELMRSLLDDPVVRGAALTALAKSPMQAERQTFLEALEDPRTEVVEAAVSALAKLPPPVEPVEQAKLISALRRLDRDAREYAVRDRIVQLVSSVTGEGFGFITGSAGYKPQRESVARWSAYAETIAPGFAAPASGEWDDIRANLAASERLTGDASRGKSIYDAKSCGRCHDGGSVGPDLAGITGRFSREDLLLAIAEPDRDISSRYRGTLIQTRDGKIVTGLVVYESADGVTLKDGENTWRVESEQIEFRKPLETSLMPRGLLKHASPQEVADLLTYLGTIGK